MATYKVIQDIEAEDHILGPLSLRQFIYALITVFFLYLCFVCVTKHVPFMLAVFLPPAIFTGFFAFPFRQDQPTEVWALAKIRFLFKPRRRIWDQSGVKELVTITVPKRVEHVYSNGLSQTEVRSRLRALADTIDSRGWAIKNVNVNLYGQPSLLATEGDTDRLIDISSIPQPVPDADVTAADDILDESSSPIAQHMSQMISESTQAHRQQLMDHLSEARAQAAPPSGSGQPADYWFLQPAAAAPPPPGQTTFQQSSVILPGTHDDSGAAQPTADDQALLAHLKADSTSHHISNSHLKTIQPLGDNHPAPAPTSQQPLAAPVQSTPPPVTAPPDPAILNLANNNDLNVATLAREAQKAKNPEEPPQDEVVISLH